MSEFLQQINEFMPGWAQEYFNRFWIKSEFIKALHRRYAEEGINIPYPIRAINLDQEGSVGRFGHTGGLSSTSNAHS